MTSTRRRVSGCEAVQGTGSGSMSIALALLAFSVFINYIDRGNLSIAAPTLKAELGMSASQVGLLLLSLISIFLFLDLLALPDSVGLACRPGECERGDGHWFSLWSAATSATGSLHGFTAFPPGRPGATSRVRQQRRLAKRKNNRSQHPIGRALPALGGREILSPVSWTSRRWNWSRLL